MLNQSHTDLKMDNHSQPSTGNVSSSRRKSSIFPSFLRNNASSKEALNSSDSFTTIDHDPVPSAEFYENTTYSSKSRPTYDDFMNSTKVRSENFTFNLHLIFYIIGYGQNQWRRKSSESRTRLQIRMDKWSLCIFLFFFKN